jgi:protease IV
MKKFLLLLLFLVVAVVSCVAGRRMGAKPQEGGSRHVQVVRLEGEIGDSRRVVERLQDALEDSSVRAVVLRIESPGGAVGASQEIYQEVRAVDRVKPVVASIGNVGASGGYYSALGARRIWANPGSLTGSIGVITQFTDVHALMDKIGIRSEVVKSGESKDAGSPFRPLTDREKALFQAMVRDVYSQFRDVVVERRHVDSAALDTLADGRVLTGRQAWKAKLIDTVGTLLEAQVEARRLAKLPSDAEVVEQEPHLPLWRRLLDSDDDAESLSRLWARTGGRVELRMP